MFFIIFLNKDDVVSKAVLQLHHNRSGLRKTKQPLIWPVWVIQLLKKESVY